MTIALTIAAILVLFDLRMGFDYYFTPHILFNYAKTDMYWLDFDLFPTFIGAVILLVCAMKISGREPRLDVKPARTKSAFLIGLSLITFAQASGRYIAQYNRESGSSAINPGFTADIIYSIGDIIIYSLAAVLLGNIIDLLQYEVSLNENSKRKDLMEAAAPFAVYYRTFCAFPVFIRIFMTIMIWDESVLISYIASTLYYAVCLFSVVMFALYVKKIEKARLG